jgi:hypothetical protein
VRRLLAAGVLVLSACAQQLPAAECDPLAEASLPCEKAVRVAAQALPNDHPPVMRVQFLSGYFSSGCGAVLLQGVNDQLCTSVVFTFVDSSRQYVGVYLDGDQLAVDGPWP